MHSTFIEINGRKIGPGHPVYIIAEMSANHGQNFDEAVKIIKEAKNAGADAIKLQTYTADTITIDCNNEYFLIKNTIWKGKKLYDLYQEAYTPWEWQPKLKTIANDLGMDLFSSPFDFTAIKFLEEMNVPAYKVASFENVDFPLIKRIAKTGKPTIISTGMASLSEISDAMKTFFDAGGKQLALLKCTSSYPAKPEQANLKTIPNMYDTFKVPIGLSDHTIGITIPVAAVTLGACIVEKHFTLSRANDGPDSKFSLEPSEFKEMVDAVRTAEKSLGSVTYSPAGKETSSKNFRRSLFIVQDVKKGEEFTTENIRSIRPSDGLHTKYYESIIGKKSRKDVSRGTPLKWDLID
ncbi:MAG: Pseudaminic acid synthase [Candidatus Heimdallarchaeota archaeon LC_3]|nr:MAG: Pseudaminic acid synthase [Candidatus Heimdallarchaeota archaeon LC_3]